MTNEETVDGKEEVSELTGAIKNGLEREESLEKIKSSLLNAGYSTEEVEEALANNLKDIKEKTIISQQTLKGLPRKPKKKLSKLIIILVILVLLIIGGVLFFFFKDSIMDLLNQIL